MNLLAITLCVLMKVILITGERLPAPLNPNKIALTMAKVTQKITTPKPLFTLHHYPQSSNKILYSYSYDTDTGIQAHENGHLNYLNTKHEALETHGGYSYKDAEGNSFQVSYVANENGFQPEGAHLPTIPPLIKRVLQYSAKHLKENKNK